MTRGNQREKDRQKAQKKPKPPATKTSGPKLAERRSNDIIALQTKQKLKTDADGGTLKRS